MPLPDFIVKDVMMKAKLNQDIKYISSMLFDIVSLENDAIDLFGFTHEIIKTTYIRNHHPTKRNFDIKKYEAVINVLKEYENIRGYIYRGALYFDLSEYKDGYITSGGSGGDVTVLTTKYGRVSRFDVSYWSLLPDVALAFIGRAKKVNLDKEYAIYVASYDPTYCTKMLYVGFGEDTILKDSGIYAIGDIRYIPEVEVRCVKLPVNRVKYIIRGDELRQLLLLLIKNDYYISTEVHFAVQPSL